MRSKIIPTLLPHHLTRHLQRDISRGSWGPEFHDIETSAGRLRVRDTQGSGPVLLMAPDGPCVQEHYEALVARLRPHARVLMLDMPGFGFSLPAPTFDFSAQATSRMFAEVLDQREVRRANLVMTCANGLFALHFARTHPERVERVVLGQTPSLGSMRAWTDRVVPDILRIPYVGQVVMGVARRRLATSWFDLSLPRDSPDLAWMKRCSSEAAARGGAFCLACLVQGLQGARARDFEEVEAPVLMIHGDRDFSHKHTTFETLREHVPGAQVETFEGVGHFPDLERPGCWAERVLEWCAGGSNEQEV